MAPCTLDWKVILVLGNYSDATVITLASFSASGMSLSVSLVKSLSALRTSPDILWMVVGW